MIQFLKFLLSVLMIYEGAFSCRFVGLGFRFWRFSHYIFEDILILGACAS